MKKITELAVRAFISKKPFRRDNTQTDGTTLYLWGNSIARWDNGILFISSAGWETKTTKERLNGLLSMLNLPCITQRNFIWYVGDMPWWNSNEFFPIQ